ncbi:PhzF family phenazine biosynthesis protein [Oceaniserpentilla sp. 4NH20-0058]|uniref:PhzF family phenazine biosynthesis protein n=1 Tax=Oceaniserpentilla sp. 4NH20-0058 TaxID=3127660 RepID=UPI0031034B5B
MKLLIYQVDAFAKRLFEGNPAAVVPLESWLPDDVMQTIAAENNLSETAFFVEIDSGFHIRWFTPTKEVSLCGHATLASAFVLFEQLGFEGETLVFDSLSGELSVNRTQFGYTLNFPSQMPEQSTYINEIERTLGVKPIACFEHEDIVAVFESENVVRSLDPDFSILKTLPLRGVIATAQSEEYDFVARFFAPKFGIDEDPVTGSAYTKLAPYWAGVLNKTHLNARQISKRGGDVHCVLDGDRVLISGGAVLYMKGEIDIN